MIKGLKGISRYIVGVRCTRALGAISSLALVGLLLMTIVPIYGVVDDIEAVSVGTGSHLDFTLNNAVASVSVSPNFAQVGRFATSTNDQKISFNISTTNITGYTLKIKSNSSDTTLTNGGSHSFLASLTRSITPAAFASVNGEAYNNRWGYSPNYYNSATTTSYYPAPSTSGNTLRATTGANSSPDAYTIGLGIRITSSTPAGTYSYTNNGDTNSNDGNPAMFILEYVANPVSYSVTFVDDVDHNATMPSAIVGSTVNNDFSNCYWDSNHQSCDNAGEVVTLPSTAPTATGRTFVGWCDVITTLDGTSCNGTIYTAGDPYPIDKTANINTVTMHAVWQLVEYPVTVRFACDGIDTVSLQNSTYGGGGTAARDGHILFLKHGVSYTITATVNSGTQFVKWSAVDGTLGSTANNPTTYSTTSMDTITATGKKSLDLYSEVCSMNKGTQKPADLRVAISTTNSGVYEYDPDMFGVATSDYGNTEKIYYYRGILDSDLDGTSNTYGSNGDGVTWPNYVKIDNTCWRIVRTMGDGGIKMIYNGSYSGGTTANSCANATTNARYGAAAYSKKGASNNSTWQYNVTRVGYTYNPAVDDVTTATAVGTVFGDDNNSNSEASNMKARLSAFNGAVMTRDWDNVLDANVGYCNDRSVYGTAGASVALGTIVPYASASATAYFGAYNRNRYATETPIPTLSCPRGSIDIYTGPTASFGNKQNGGATGLLTADEVSFAGSGVGSSASVYHANSFLRSGNAFWTMSPSTRAASGTTNMNAVSTSGSLTNLASSSSYGYRPVIGLKPGVSASSGSGTAVNPWVVVP